MYDYVQFHELSTGNFYTLKIDPSSTQNLKNGHTIEIALILPPDHRQIDFVLNFKDGNIVWTSSDNNWHVASISNIPCDIEAEDINTEPWLELLKE